MRIVIGLLGHINGFCCWSQPEELDEQLLMPCREEAGALRQTASALDGMKPASEAS